MIFKFAIPNDDSFSGALVLSDRGICCIGKAVGIISNSHCIVLPYLTFVC